MLVKVATLCSWDCRKLGKITNPNKQQYCDSYGYKYALKTTGIFKSIKRLNKLGWHYPVFERWRYFLSVLETCDAVFCLGADVLITNHNIKLENILNKNKSFIICADAVGLQTDVMLIKNTLKTKKLIKELLEIQDKFSNYNFLDQTALESLVPKYSNIVSILPQRAMNSFDYTTLKSWYGTNPNYEKAIDINGSDGQWKMGDFILHTPGLPIDKKIEILKSYLPLVTYKETYRHNKINPF